jgi:hypothetical protein
MRTLIGMTIKGVTSAPMNTRCVQALSQLSLVVVAEVVAPALMCGEML